MESGNQLSWSRVGWVQTLTYGYHPFPSGLNFFLRMQLQNISVDNRKFWALIHNEHGASYNEYQQVKIRGQRLQHSHWMADDQGAGLIDKTRQKVLLYIVLYHATWWQKIPVGPNWLRLDPSHSKKQSLLFAVARVSTGRVTYDSQSFQICAWKSSA